MNIWTLILILVLALSIVLGIGAMSPDPVGVGLQYEMEKQADIETEAAKLQRAKQVKIDALEVEVAEAAKNETINSQKVNIWVGEYAKTVGIISIAGVVFMVCLSFSTASAGFAVAFVRKANLQAELIYPDRVTLQFPVHEYSLVSTDGHRRWFAKHYGTGEISRLDTANPADTQMIAAMAENQALAISAGASVGVSKNTADEKQNWFVGLLRGMANTSALLEKRQ